MILGTNHGEFGARVNAIICLYPKAQELSLKCSQTQSKHNSKNHQEKVTKSQEMRKGHGLRKMEIGG
jgi:hypothetical protein